MPPQIARLYRHPVKALGVETLDSAALVAGKTLPWDRIWAVAHEAARIAPGADDWQPCTNFCRGAKFPELMAVRAATDEATGRVTLTHPARPAATFDLDDPADAARLIDWMGPLTDAGRAQPVSVYRARDRGLTDSDFPSISILSQASLAALEARMDRPLAVERFRANVWIDGLGPWAEFDLVGRDIRLGAARLRVRDRITRCKATNANPETGRVDADTLKALEAGWGHRDFGIAAEVTQGGRVAVGDTLELA